MDAAVAGVRDATDTMAFDDVFREAEAVANDLYAHATEFASDCVARPQVIAAQGPIPSSALA
jgi:hypothetical protein